MNPNTSIRIPAHLWDYKMAPAETVFLAYLYELKLARLRGENHFNVESYSAFEIVDCTPIQISLARFYRYRKTLIRKRLLIQKQNTVELNPHEFKKWHDAVDGGILFLLEGGKLRGQLENSK